MELLAVIGLFGEKDDGNSSLRFSNLKGSILSDSILIGPSACMVG